MTAGPRLKVDLPYLYSDVDRFGTRRYYFRKAGRKTRLREAPGSDAFLKEYWSHRHGTAKETPAETLGHERDGKSLRWLISQYYGSAEYRVELKPRTQTVRQRILTRICNTKKRGQHPFEMLEPRHIRKWRDERADAPEAANAMVKALRQVFAWGIEAGHTEANPAAAVKYIRRKTSGHHPWSVPEIHQYLDRHGPGTMARRAMIVLLFCGGRRADAVTLGRQHVRDGWLTYTQQKTGQQLSIPVLPMLEEEIRHITPGQLTFIVTSFGRPFTSNGFGNRMRKWCDAAGLPHCAAHGLRKAGATIAAENGASEYQLMAMFGWVTPKEAGRYVATARRKKLAAAAPRLLILEDK